MADSVSITLADLVNDPKFDFIKSLNPDPSHNNFDFLNIDDLDSPYSQEKFLFSYLDETEYCTSNYNVNRFRVMSLNIQSLHSKFSELKNTIIKLGASGCSPDIICLQEIWLVIDNNMFNIPGYQPLIDSSRRNNQGSGVRFYIKTDIDFKK